MFSRPPCWDTWSTASATYGHSSCWGPLHVDKLPRCPLSVSSPLQPPAAACPPSFSPAGLVCTLQMLSLLKPFQLKAPLEWRCLSDPAGP